MQEKIKDSLDEFLKNILLWGSGDGIGDFWRGNPERG